MAMSAVDGGAKNVQNHSDIIKYTFQTKTTRRDGLLLQVHHTDTLPDGSTRHVRLIHAAFQRDGEQLATSAHGGHIFIIDFATNKYWLLPSGGNCSVLVYSSQAKNEILVGRDDGSLLFIDTEWGCVSARLVGHTSPVIQASFASHRPQCLSASADQALIWDLTSYTQIHKLTLSPNVHIKQVMFMPVSDNILACFQDDELHVWKCDTFECLKQITPDSWKSHHLRSIAFTRDGRAMVVGGFSLNLAVFSLDEWSLQKLVLLPEYVGGVRQLEFVPQLFDGGANKILGLLSSNSSVYFMDIETSTILKTVIQLEGSIGRLVCSETGKYLACVLQSGECNVYSTSTLLPSGQQTQQVIVQAKRQDSAKPKTTNQRNRLNLVQTQINSALDLDRLQPLLTEFGEYPETYRCVIWKSVLRLPNNQPAYTGLVLRDSHPSFQSLHMSHPLHNKALLKTLIRCLSCLAHWSPLFGQVKFLPYFLFPFVKLFKNDPLGCFETVATVIVNWCQLWFEFFPLPPVNVLSAIENLLSEHDSQLLNWFVLHGVSSHLYAWTLLENAMSEVLTEKEWLCLWDHILSNEPCFLLMAVVAYNITCRSALLACNDANNFQFFFRNQNPIDMKRFISKMYQLHKRTKQEKLLRLNLKEFQPLVKGSTYQIFNEYPKYVVDSQADRLQELQKEETELFREEAEAARVKAEQEVRRAEFRQTEFQQQKLSELEGHYRNVLNEEEDRVSRQRSRVLALRKQMREREADLLKEARNRILSENTSKRQAVLNKLLLDIDAKRAHEERELREVEEEARRHYIQLAGQKVELERELSLAELTELPQPDSAQFLLEKNQHLLNQEINKLCKGDWSDRHSRQMELANRVAIVDNLIQRVETELAQEMAERQQHYRTAHNNMEILQLEGETKELEKEVEGLLGRLVECRVAECKQKIGHVVRSKQERVQLLGGQLEMAKAAGDHNPIYGHPQLENSSECLFGRSSGIRGHRPSLATHSRSLSDLSIPSSDKYSRAEQASREAINVRRNILHKMKSVTRK